MSGAWLYGGGGGASVDGRTLGPSEVWRDRLAAMGNVEVLPTTVGVDTFGKAALVAAVRYDAALNALAYVYSGEPAGGLRLLTHVE